MINAQAIFLGSIEICRLVGAEVAEALKFSFYAGTSPEQQRQDYLREKRLLLVMDNYEHLLEGVKVVIDLRRIAPGLKVLATSRSRLNVQEEQRFPISGIDFPEVVSAEATHQSSAGQLFLENARRVQADFALPDENMSSVVQLCRLVQGIPLGIILAAGWLEMLSSAEIAGLGNINYRGGTRGKPGKVANQST